MFGKAMTSAIAGVDGRTVVVEADFSDGLPAFEMVGFLSAEVREAKERVRSAIRNAGIVVPPGKLTVNLSPADLKKQGNSFDLPIAVAILVSLGVIPEEYAEQYAFIGELSLDGMLRPVTGTISHVMRARENGLKKAVLPVENAPEGAVFHDFSVYPSPSLKDVIELLMHPGSRDPMPLTAKDAGSEHGKVPDFIDVRGQERIKRSAAIASAGMHGFLMIGPPGTGKTLTAKRIPSIMPPLTETERIECTKIHSVAGTLDRTAGLISIRPFRAPHHTISANALVGGGSFPRPGEMSLAHNGVLFLDELPEFSKMTLEVMRQPLEDRKVVISRVHGSYVFPTRVMLVSAMNPCKCGFFPDRNKCRCTEAEVRQYLSRVSRPLLDRIDIFAEVPRIRSEALDALKPGLSSEELRRGVIKAWEAEKERYRNEPFRFNSDLEGAALRKYCEIGAAGREILKEAMETLNLSARAHDRILKVARTIADFEGADAISEVHLAEAISYRSLNDKFWGGI